MVQGGHSAIAGRDLHGLVRAGIYSPCLRNGVKKTPLSRGFSFMPAEVARSAA